eukprot:TRINITY_DN9950_c1_g2_i1.p1 TRINITY_DN9950_c1_g2~~TRINITY_DN9950_c1_g2_i1.p1  ORF type:complete len:342 (+),score=16.84 TRINITY_DN9950_c1_g2_i1:60-1085(+)
MPIASRLDWIARQIWDGRDAHIAIGSARDDGKLKVKVLLFASSNLHPLVRDSLLTTVQYLKAMFENGLVVMDRGHKHSNGISEINIWAHRVDSGPMSPHLAASGLSLNPDAIAFSPGSITNMEPYVHQSPKTHFQGQWEALPATHWEVIYRRFEYNVASNALKSYCVFASEFFAKITEIRQIMAHCSETHWGKDFLSLLRRTELRYGAVRDIDHSHKSLVHHCDEILAVHDLVTDCVKRCQELPILIACYPRRGPKRYKFQRPADLAVCRFTHIELADFLLQLEREKQKYWMAILCELYWSNHTWVSKNEIQQIDPLYLLQQLRPYDRVDFERRVSDSLQG